MNDFFIIQYENKGSIAGYGVPVAEGTEMSGSVGEKSYLVLKGK